MSEVTPDKGPGRGKGKFTAKGVQAAMANNIEELKALVADFGARLDAIEAGDAVELDPDVPYVDNTLPGDLPAEGA